MIGLITPSQNEYRSSEYLDELAFLVETAGAVAVKRFTQRLDVPHPKTFVGKGKLEEIQSFALVNEIDLLVFDDELSPSQVKNLGVFFGESIKVLDRSNLILDIFAGRAQTAQAKAQVELAQLEYTLPRLTKMWTHLSRQKGGIGMRGPGEREIETDRRIVRNNIALLKTRLQKIDQQNETRRKSRSDKIRVALVGYTNVGKSTLMNQLSDSEILAENKLFATLDTTVRKVVLDTVPFLLSDTVGFIRKLPHHLVESFKSTLDEVREADILVHVVDMAHDAWEAHILVVDSILAELGAVGKPTILVFNKIDLLREKLAKDGTVAYGPMVKGIKKQYLGPKAARVVFVSAAQKEHMDELKKALIIEIKQAYKLMYPYRANPY